ncbi:hypothetical protein AALP_AA1G075900 [Arabis alpina]|uniref:Uncharacterized protein n=1 Tax=Arabis alpina TaxID=50452 RepID=A0A087HLS4_ARAAL|nr:hypothetical protein AALP_AA1G075900 [Arabis alpina]
MEPPSAGPVPTPEPPDPGLDAAQSFDSPHPPIPPEPPPIASHVSRLRATVGFPRIVPNLDLQLMLVDCSSPLEFCGTSLWCVSMNKIKLKELVNAIFPATMVSSGIFCLESSGCSESKITNTSDLVLLKGSQQ